MSDHIYGNDIRKSAFVEPPAQKIDYFYCNPISQKIHYI